MAERTLGWIQNPSSFENLKNVVSVFDKNSDIYKEILNTKLPKLVKDLDLQNKLISELKKDPLEMDYVLLKGHGIKSGQKRADAVVLFKLPLQHRVVDPIQTIGLLMDF